MKKKRKKRQSRLRTVMRSLSRKRGELKVKSAPRPRPAPVDARPHLDGAAHTYDPSLDSALADIATQVWRAKAKMLDSATGEARQEMGRVYRHIERIVGALQQIGVETVDPIGRAYDAGMALKVVSFELTPGISTDAIKETLRPSVAWQGRLIQLGEVIVGTPQPMATAKEQELA